MTSFPPDQPDGRRRQTVLSREDCLCPVCLDVFMEPVTLPCTHTFCKDCFQQSVDLASLCCPLCRRRVSTWARLHTRSNTLVNQQLWTSIQTRFPRQPQDVQEETVTSLPRVCQPGELRQEYEDQINKLTEERRVLEAEQSRASEELIVRLLEEEQQQQQEESRRSQEDQELARRLSDQLNHPPPPSGVPGPALQKKDVIGHIDRFLSPLRPSSTNFLSNKENRHCSEPRPLSSEPCPLSSEPCPLSSEPCPLHSPRPAGGSVKRRSSELEEEEEELWARRRQQEEEDRRLALLLQRKMDQEERDKATDRRKGTASAYLLRRGGGARGRGADKIRKCSASSSSSTPSSQTDSSSPSHRRTKQKTLTEMFNAH